MTTVVKTLVQARPVGKELLLTSNIPFLDRNNPDVYLTSFQRDFQPVYSKKTELVHQPAPSQVDHKDMRHIKEYLTETMVSYPHHPLPQITHIPRWTMLQTNFKMQTDPGELAFLTTHSQKYQPHPLQPPPATIRPAAIKKIQRGEKLPRSTTQATFIPHHGSSFVKATVKHLEEGFPTIKGDGRHHSFVSHYNNAFQGAWARAAQSVKKHSSSVHVGDPVKIVERKTTHASSFSWPTVCRPPVVKERFKLSRGNLHKDSWSSTSRDAFCHHKLGDPVVRIKNNQNFSSLPKGDTDAKRNKERMSVTTSRISFSDLNHTQRPVYVYGPDLTTKSNIQFSPPSLSGLYYTTTAKEYFSKKGGERARPVIPLPSNILSGPEQGPHVSTTMADFVRLKTCKQTLCSSQQMSNLKFPLADQCFSTTNSEAYTAKPLILQRPDRSQFLSHFDLK